jgi:hypothetical protein
VTVPPAAGEPEIAWKAIEDGAEVVGSDGEVGGHVSRVVGDVDADVFTGLAIRTRTLGKERFLASESVGRIWARRIEVDRPSGAFDDLPAYEDAPVVYLRPAEGGGAGGFLRRLFGGGRDRA